MGNLNDLFKETRERLEALNLKQLQYLLDRHDEWFLSKEELPEERAKVKKNKKESIILWILDTDPIFADGGLFSFLEKYLELEKNE